MGRVIASLNAGSSSIKFALFHVGQDEFALAASGKVEGIGTAPHLVAHDAAGTILIERTWDGGDGLSHEALLQELLHWAAGHLPEHEIVAVGHRVAHGGLRFGQPALVDDALLAALEMLCPLVPLHQPHNLAVIRAIRALRPELPQIACFDTGFHQGRPEVATRFALPRALHDRGIRSYGFHGLSYEYIAHRLSKTEPAFAGKRLIVAHLGNGASLCAMHAGKSVDTTMSFTALDGLVMGTRCGTIDPGVLLYLQTQDGKSVTELETLLYSQSGLLGVSGVSSDMRVLHASSDPHAIEAIDLFVWRAAREAGALISSLGGIDGLVFTAGIGENDPVIRAAICERLAWTGLIIDAEANRRNATTINATGSSVAVRVIPTDEERMIAMHAVAFVMPAQRA
ncbi:acetate/propionate family kinase [Sphingomonas sp. MMS24-J13]|uniref:acetate/propionate family kinase n=1 Tax=Sphingomonas sp. MMS24-J13 TaxID=3238686 RepID=UPI00384A5F9B